MPTPPTSVYPRRSRPSFHLARQLDEGRNNTSNEVRFVSKNVPVVGLKNSNQAFAGLQNQLHAALSQSLEGANRWNDNKQLLRAMMKGFFKQGRQSRATTTTRRGKELTHIPTLHDRPTQHHRVEPIL
jgi:hypothetical protein